MAGDERVARDSGRAAVGGDGNHGCRDGVVDGRGDPTRARKRVLADGGRDPSFFETLVSDVGVGVGVYDDSGRFTDVNDAYAALLDRDPEELVGEPIWEVGPTVDADRFDDYWASFDAGETRRRETVHRRADGTELPVETYTTAVESEGTRYHVAVVTDRTESGPERAELQRQDERLEQFASVVSHDLRNPLNVAMGRLRLAMDDCDSEHLGSVETSLDRMEALIDDVLALARQGSRLTDPEPVSLREAVRTAWSTAGVDAATLDVADDLGVVRSDESRLCELFENLFRNAVEHGSTSPPFRDQEDAVEHDSTSPPSRDQEDGVEPDESGVTVTVGLLDAGFYVADDGPGVDPDDREDVFEYGYSTTQDGTGFGLAIVEQIAEAHGWTVELTDSGSGGARFEFHGVDVE